jgi:4-hydroxy-tetrahydrodipicolinate reductase
MTVSLSEPFASDTGDEARCYKLIAAIFLAPKGWNPPVAAVAPPPVVEETPEPAPPKRGGKKRGMDAVAEPKPEPKPEPISEPIAIRVAVCGAAGRMGREVVRAVFEAEGLLLVAAIDKFGAGQDAGDFAGCGATGILLEEDLEAALLSGKPDVMVDFTLPDSVLQNLRVALRLGVSPVVGTTGLSAVDLLEIDNTAKEREIGAFVAPNFAIGAVLMMEFAAQAAKYMPDVEIIEMHHEKKLDSPSGTALLTAKKIAEARTESPAPLPKETVEKVSGARGATLNDIPIHSVRLPGYVAHQEVIFGGLGQTLTLRHDSLDRRSFMPGVTLAVRKVRTLTGLTVGLEKLL